jgi:heparan-alpha-glucosaminide N-acetyltransferase
METTFGLAEPADLSMSAPASASFRVTSIDAVRGLVMFTMIFVNDIAGVSEDIVPAWMRHYRGPDGMTFVDLVFPAFLFIVGMSIPFALGARIMRGEPWWRCLGHVAVRTMALLFIGVLMVNESPDSGQMGWSASVWSTLMYLSAILWFGSISPMRGTVSSPDRRRVFGAISMVLRIVGFVCLVWLAFAWRGESGRRIISLSPFSINTEWWGILGLIGWAYLVSAIVFLLFRDRGTALLGCVVLLMCLYPASRTGAFEHFPLARYVGIGDTLGSQAAISVAGMLLVSVLVNPDTRSNRSLIRFAVLFIAGCSAGALLLDGLYGINKNSATPSWCLWACAITAAIWLIAHLLSETRVGGWLTGPFSVAGRNVLLAYLLSNVLWYVLDLLRLGDWYDQLAEPGIANAVARSAGVAAVILLLSVVLNRLGFRLKL